MPAHGYGNIYTTALTVNGCSLLPVGLLLVGCSGHWCGCSDKYNCASCWWALLATSWAAPCRTLWSVVWLLWKLVCTHTTVSVGAATKRRVAKDKALHVQYLLKSILCNSHKQIQQLTTPDSSNPFPFIPESLPRVSSWLSNHQGGHQGHWTPVDQWDARHNTGWPMRHKAQGSSQISFYSIPNLVTCWQDASVLKAISGPGISLPNLSWAHT